VAPERRYPSEHSPPPPYIQNEQLYILKLQEKSRETSPTGARKGPGRFVLGARAKEVPGRRGRDSGCNRAGDVAVRPQAEPNVCPAAERRELTK
jgi:hypothetical protein